MSAALYSHTRVAPRQYLKMVKMGVPKGAVAHKMRVTGLDPSVLELEPTALVPLRVVAATPRTRPVRLRRRLAWTPVTTTGGSLMRGGWEYRKAKTSARTQAMTQSGASSRVSRRVSQRGCSDDCRCGCKARMLTCS